MNTVIGTKGQDPTLPETKRGEMQERRQFANSIFLGFGRDGASLTDRKMMLLLDVANGQAWRGMLKSVKSAKICLKSFRDDPIYGSKWNVDGRVLVEMIDALTDGQACFLGGFLRGCWHNVDEEQ